MDDYVDPNTLAVDRLNQVTGTTQTLWHSPLFWTFWKSATIAEIPMDRWKLASLSFHGRYLLSVDVFLLWRSFSMSLCCPTTNRTACVGTIHSRHNRTWWFVSCSSFFSPWSEVDDFSALYNRFPWIQSIHLDWSGNYRTSCNSVPSLLSRSTYSRWWLLCVSVVVNTDDACLSLKSLKSSFKSMSSKLSSTVAVIWRRERSSAMTKNRLDMVVSTCAYAHIVFKNELIRIVNILCCSKSRTDTYRSLMFFSSSHWIYDQLITSFIRLIKHTWWASLVRWIQYVIIDLFNRS